MKSRSHRPSTKDDWAEEESWTVDCICGVNFDDGEEMVNCDECGVWVHTRCSRYVKSEKLFACDKCKNKNNRNDSEETEVAQLLVELPTKTLRMEKPPPSSYNPSILPPPRRPFRLWTDIPIGERVHVQGVPGGDPALFSGLSSVFGPQLWKSTGYIPKKFNIQYKEFPSWDDEGELPQKEIEKENSRDSYNTADNGAGVLLSMSKENLSSVSLLDTVGLKTRAEDAKVGSLKNSEQINNLEGENLKVSRPVDETKDQSLLQSSIQSGKRKKEDLGVLKDKNGKKKSRGVEKDGEFKAKPMHAQGTDRGPKVVKVDPQTSKHANLSNHLPAGQLSQGPGFVDHANDDYKNHLASSKTNLQRSSADASSIYSNGAIISKEDHDGHEIPAKLEDSPKTINGVPSPLAYSDSAGVPLKGEVVSDAVDGSNGNGIGCALSTNLADFSEPFVENVTASLGDHSTSDSTINMVQFELNVRSKAELGDNCEVFDVLSSLKCDPKLDNAGAVVPYQENSADCPSESDMANVADATTFEASNTADVDRSFGLVNAQKDRGDDESPDEHHKSIQDSGSAEDSLGAKKGSTGFDLKSVDEQSKCMGTIPSHPAAIDACSVAASLGSPSLVSSVDLSVTKPPPANQMNIIAQSQDMDTKQKGTSESSFTSIKDTSDTYPEVIKDEETYERQKKLVKELAKSSIISVSKSSQSKKVLHASVSKRILSDSKESMLHSNLKSPPLPTVSATSRSEPSTMLHTEGASSIQKKACTFQTEPAPNLQKKVAVLPQKGEKINQSASQSSSKANASLPHAASSSSSPATLSDEELALLLHQELNSSPRVPRVPRMRHAGSLPQLTSPTATSMLMKRTSSAGGKEHILTFRRKAKDITKDGSHGVREVDDETKKMERLPSSSDQGRQDSGSGSDVIGKREVDGALMKVTQTIKKGNASISGATTTSGFSSPTEANENNLSSAHHSPRNHLDDGKGVVSRSTHRTLPGLIAEIMSKGERMTYEELCNAVLPHWPNLRKHNGERYAYSSHSQAVLDCLRNRSEWARLVDRGPKTSGGRKRRKLDADSAGIDSEDNDDNTERTTAKDVRRENIESHHEEFPKGKRKARRRRLALQGRGIKDVRRRRRIEEFSDEEVASFSNSSEETMLSEDETQGVGNSRVRNGSSAASDGI